MSTREFRVSQKASLVHTFTKEQVGLFADLCGDSNPLHVDENFAAGTRFKRCIVHGTFYTAFLGTVMGMKFPGPGTVLLHQEHNFFKPVFVGDTITAEVEISAIVPDKHILHLLLRCYNREEQDVLRGRATVFVPLLTSS